MGGAGSAVGEALAAAGVVMPRSSSSRPISTTEAGPAEGAIASIASVPSGAVHSPSRRSRISGDARGFSPASRTSWEYRIASCDFLCHIRNYTTRQADVDIPYAAKTDQRCSSAWSHTLIVNPL